MHNFDRLALKLAQICLHLSKKLDSTASNECVYPKHQLFLLHSLIIQTNNSLSLFLRVYIDWRKEQLVPIVCPHKTLWQPDCTSFISYLHVRKVRQVRPMKHIWQKTSIFTIKDINVIEWVLQPFSIITLNEIASVTRLYRKAVKFSKLLQQTGLSFRRQIFFGRAFPQQIDDTNPRNRIGKFNLIYLRK